MANVRLPAGQNLTLATWVEALRNSLSGDRMALVDRDVVLRATRERGIPIKDGRIDRLYQADLYFGCARILGVIE